MYSFESTRISIWFGACKMRRLNQALQSYRWSGIVEIHEIDIIMIFINKIMTTESKQTKIKTFCDGSGKNRLEWLQKEPL